MIALWRLAQMKNYKNLHRGLTRIREKINKNITRGLKIDRMSPKEISEKAEAKLRLRDQLSKNYTLIYKSSLKNYVYLCYHGSYIVFGVSFYGMYHAIAYRDEYEFLKPDRPGELITANIAIHSQLEIILIYSTLLIMNGFLFLLCRRHVLRIWRHNKDQECVMILPTFFPNSCRKIVFKAGSAVQKYPRARNDFTRAPHVINGKTYHINDYNFRTPAEYNKVMVGY